MIDLKQLQRQIYQNKVNKGFNVTNVHQEFCLTHGELAEAYIAYCRKKNDFGEELADVAIYLLGLAEIMGIDLEQEIVKKVAINERRVYVEKDGLLVRVDE